MRYHGQANSSPSSSSFPPLASAANSAPFLLVATASVDRLIEAIPSPWTFTRNDLIRRMRPNLVVETRTPFEEDTWKRLRIGAVEFEVAGPCSRCQMVNISGENGQRTSEPLQSIVRLRGKEVDCLISCWFSGSIDWSLDWLLDWLIACVIDRLIDWLIALLIDWLVACLGLAWSKTEWSRLFGVISLFTYVLIYFRCISACFFGKSRNCLLLRVF